MSSYKDLAYAAETNATEETMLPIIVTDRKSTLFRRALTNGPSMKQKL